MWTVSDHVIGLSSKAVLLGGAIKVHRLPFVASAKKCLQGSTWPRGPARFDPVYSCVLGVQLSADAICMAAAS